MKRITTELAEEIRNWFESAEVREVLSATEKAQDADTGTFEVVITTENLDRYQEVISLAGWELEHYRNNPVVLWGHDHNHLIGIATSIEIVDGKMVAKGKFAPTEEGQEKRKLYEQGFLRATSVGFIEKEREGNLITKSELLEFSFVSVPANPYALSLALKEGRSIDELVTRGIMFVEKEAEPEPELTPEPEPQPEPTPEEKQYAQKAVASIIDQAKALVIALEALTTEPEREEEPTAETPEGKQFREFSEKRKTLQDAATLIGEVLAEARQAMEAHKEEIGT